MRRSLTRSERMARAAMMAGALAALMTASVLARAESLDELAVRAAKAGEVAWYESSPEDQADKVIAAFHKRYPQVKVKFVRLVGGNELAARAVQEMQARGTTGDLLTGGADHIWELNARGYLLHVDWQELGIPKALTPSAFGVVTAASVYVVLWNTDEVKDEEAPKTWEELLDPKWAGRSGAWVRAGDYAELAAVWGKQKAQSELERYVALRPLLFKSTFPLAQAVGAGEVDVAVGFYHSTQPPVDAGAPIHFRSLDPTPMHTIFSGISKTARNADGAKLLLAWLCTPDGARAYESATFRGNPLLESTKTYALLKGKTISEFPPDKSIELGKINEEFNSILEKVGSAR